MSSIQNDLIIKLVDKIMKQDKNKDFLSALDEARGFVENTAE